MTEEIKRPKMHKLLSLLLALTMFCAVLPMMVGATLPQLATPQNVKWGDDYKACFDAVAGSEGYYEVSLYKDGGLIDSSTWVVGIEDPIESDMFPDINESGDYYFTVSAEGNDSYSESETVTSNTITYTRPSQSFGVPTNLRWETRDDGLYSVWDAPANADLRTLYDILVYRKESDGSYYCFVGTYTGLLEEKWDSNEYGINEPGSYYFTVRATSEDIDEIANGVASGYSPEYNTTDTTDQIQDILGELIDEISGGTKNLTEAKDALAELNATELAIAMQGSSGVLNLVKNIEDQYKAERNITVEKDVASDIPDLAADQITAVGAALNAILANQSMTLNFSKPVQEEVIDTSVYNNWVQFDISLTDGFTTYETLDVPIQITMPIPTGINPSRLVILHYHADGSSEMVHPNINGNLATFTVTRFSTFVFANGAAPEPAPTPGRNSGGSSGGGGGGGGSSSRTVTPPTISYVSSNVAAATGAVSANAVSTELTKELAKPGDKAVLSTRNALTISPAIIKSLASQAKKAGKAVALNADTLTADGKTVQGRFYVEPDRLTNLNSDLKLGVYTDKPHTEKTEAYFKKWFVNKIVIVDIAQKGSLGARLQLAALVNLTGFNTQNLYLYSYDVTTNTYKFIENSAYRIDKNGYLHFYTEVGGDIIVTDSPLKRR